MWRCIYIHIKRVMYTCVARYITLFRYCTALRLYCNVVHAQVSIGGKSLRESERAPRGVYIIGRRLKIIIFFYDVLDAFSDFAFRERCVCIMNAERARGVECLREILHLRG